jgi:hypothetical protein
MAACANAMLSGPLTGSFAKLAACGQQPRQAAD